jgi:lipopolysaccharide export system permease protein
MLATLGMTVFVFTLVLLLGNVIQEILQLVVKRQATIGLALHAIALLIPWVLAFSLPIGMLTAALLVFGRFSAEQELTAARASGISLISLITPILLLSVMCSGLCLWLNFDVAPSCRMAYKELLYHAGASNPGGLLQSGESTSFPGFSIWAGNVHADGSNLDNVIVSQNDTNGNLTEFAQGTSGVLVADTAHGQILLTLQNARTMHRHADGWTPELQQSGDAFFRKEVPREARKAIPLPISDMTFRQLLDKRSEIERSLSAPPARNLTKAQLLEIQKQQREMKTDETSPILVYLHRAVAFSCACISFTLVGIPLGIRSHRRETSVGVATALILMLVYYSFIILGQAWAAHPERAPYLVVWLPNFIFQAVGAVLLWKANRGV